MAECRFRDVYWAAYLDECSGECSGVKSMAGDRTADWLTVVTRAAMTGAMTGGCKTVLTGGFAKDGWPPIVRPHLVSRLPVLRHHGHRRPGRARPLPKHSRE